MKMLKIENFGKELIRRKVWRAKMYNINLTILTELNDELFSCS